jgi:hypothetical protein
MSCSFYCFISAFNSSEIDSISNFFNNLYFNVFLSIDKINTDSGTPISFVNLFISSPSLYNNPSKTNFVFLSPFFALVLIIRIVSSSISLFDA